jgi:hypothetical protein
MSEIISFSESYNYNTLKVGITVPIKLFYGESFVQFEAKVDTGARVAFSREFTQSGLALKSRTEIWKFSIPPPEILRLTDTN